MILDNNDDAQLFFKPLAPPGLEEPYVRNRKSKQARTLA
jgi:hypothetical protein